MTTAGVWHPVALSASIEPGSSAGTHIDGKEFVVWRDNSGAPHVWEDRCPHRGMKLSFGFVRGDHIACLYHGWQYDTAGQCRYIPAHPELDVPGSIRVPVFQTVEAAGMIWVATEPTESAPPAPQEAAETVSVRSVFFGAAIDTVLAAIETTPSRPFSDEAAASVLRQIDGRLYALTVGNDRLLLGLHSLSGERTALHVVIAGPAARYAGKGQAHFLAWTAELRHRIETQPAAAVAA
ncbi:MAG: Rieske (2Fe-2S) protein [Mesorhizobium sp.]|uniref:Rieske (2Fe-2S) protein n=1 Tax=Mesorhizobium sp. TaxID=1871066 RepID=UPI000FEA0A2B|nr:Rieske (2Fe-2S) protein [Mesorhizobium sp.]RWE72552.1 MAG: Rieske (2Fe-2S) protein [Mesorhizobium sp.]TIT14531.1 MAG: Rieske (2Fe-2S) protein [Mesorhizobium sp.]TJW63806.1 MAG: Rieske (2Fe-2S) protein [Mesorhizobium sp.]